MALTATLVNVTPNELTYLLVNAATAGTTLTITADGSATPDLATDCVNSTFGTAACPALRAVCRAGIDGLGDQAAGGWTAAEAKDLLLGNSATLAGGPLMPRARISTTNLSGVAGGMLPEATVSVASGVPTVVITTAAVAGEALLTVRLSTSPGL